MAGGAATWRQAVKAAPRAGAGRGAMEVDAGGRAGGGAGAAALAPGHAKWAYLALFLLTSLTSWVLRDHADGMLRGVPVLAECAGAGSSSAAAGGCRGKEAVLRLSMATFLFFFVHCVAVAGVKSVDDPRGRVHTGFFLPKTFLLVGLLVALFFAPNQVLEGYGQFARAGSALFLVFQIIVLLDSVYRANERLLERDSVALAVALAVVLYGVAFAAVGLLFHHFAGGGCSLHTAFIGITLAMGLSTTLVSVSPYRQSSAGLLTSGVVFLYALFLCWSAIRSDTEPRGGCRIAPSDAAEGDVGWVQIVGFLLALALMAKNVFSLSGRTSDLEAGLEGDSTPYRYDYFHAVFAAASMYVAMVFTGWNLEQVEVFGKFELNQGELSMWIKISSQWICFLLYTWTMVAPYLLQDRDFG